MNKRQRLSEASIKDASTMADDREPPKPARMYRLHQSVVQPKKAVLSKIQKLI